MQIVETEAVFCQGPGLEIFHQHVALGDHPAGQRLAFGVGQIERDRTLVPVGAGEIGALATVVAVLVPQIGRGEIARIVAHSRPLDLDDLGAQIAQYLRAMRAGENPGQVEYFQAVERTVHGAASFIPSVAMRGVVASSRRRRQITFANRV